MTPKELLQKVRKIEIKTRGLSQNIFAGEYHSAFKGRGMMFSEVREYQYGDDIRDIDWNVTARQGHPYVKVYEEERELTVMLLVDMSGSGLFGAVADETKREMMAEIAATLAFSASTNNDKIGAIFFTGTVEKFIPPKKGKKQILLITRELLDFKPADRSTDIGEALKYLTNALKRRCTAFLISDFIDRGDWQQPLQIARNRHDIMALQVYDKRDTQLPDIGLMRVADLETGDERWIDTSSKSVRRTYDRWWYQRQQEMAERLRAANVDFTSIASDENYVKSLMGLFKNRTARR